jgi:hypothetical protein
VRILPGTGKISRIADISASQRHVVPTALALHDGAFYLGNLGTFPITTGAGGSSGSSGTVTSGSSAAISRGTLLAHGAAVRA